MRSGEILTKNNMWRMKIPTEMTVALLAILGGAAKYIQDVLEGKDFKWKELFMHIIIGGISGYCMAQLAVGLGLGEGIQQFVSGSGGVMGLQSFFFAKRIIEKKIR